MCSRWWYGSVENQLASELATEFNIVYIKLAIHIHGRWQELTLFCQYPMWILAFKYTEESFDWFLNSYRFHSDASIHIHSRWLCFFFFFNNNWIFQSSYNFTTPPPTNQHTCANPDPKHPSILQCFVPHVALDKERKNKYFSDC